MENETALADTTDTVEDVDPEVKRRVMDALVQAQPQVLEGILYPPGFLLSRATSSALVSGSCWQNDEDMSELVSSISKITRWQTEEGKQLVTKGYRKEIGICSRTRTTGFLSHSRSRISCVPACQAVFGNHVWWSVEERRMMVYFCCAVSGDVFA